MPYPGIDDPETISKMDDCVEKVMAKGHDKSSAIAICRTSIVGGKSLDRPFSPAEMKTLRELVNDPEFVAAKSGRRNSGQDAERLHKIRDLLDELLSDEAEETDAPELNKPMPGESRNPIPGALDSAGSKAVTKLSEKEHALMVQAMHDNLCQMGAQCGCNAETPMGEALTEKPDSAGKALPVPNFNYIAKLHLTQDEEYFKDVLAVKSIDGKDTIRSYSMLWGDPQLTDVETEFFTKDTNFWDKQLEGITRPLTYDHAQEPRTKSSPVIGRIEAFGDDDIGRWMVAQLDRNHLYRKAIDQLISQHALGASSDSASQYVVRKSAGKAVWLAQWPWFASALTPTPAEPRMLDVGLPYWKSAGVDFARMGAPEGDLEIPASLRLQAALLKIKAGVK